jgi:hypothetical protein
MYYYHLNKINLINILKLTRLGYTLNFSFEAKNSDSQVTNGSKIMQV